MKTCTFCKENIQNWQHGVKSSDGLTYHNSCYKQELKQIKEVLQ